MNDKTKTTNATGSIFLVTYKFATPSGVMRGGQIAIEAKDANEARTIAEEKIATFGLRYPRINSIKPY